MRAPIVPLAAALILLSAGAACDLTDPFPDVDYAVDGSAGGSRGGDDGTGGTGGMEPTDECAEDDQCPAGTPVCEAPAGMRARRCAECRDSSYCPSELPVCDGALRCVPGDRGVCRDEFDCPVLTPQCMLLSNGQVGVCIECFGSSDCPRASPQCSTAGRCIAEAAFPGCAGDEECGPGRVCDGNQACVER